MPVVPDAVHHREVFAVVHPCEVALYRNFPSGSPRNVWKGTIGALDLEGERVRVRVEGELPIVAWVYPV